jgi:hypothetical protein
MESSWTGQRHTSAYSSERHGQKHGQLEFLKGCGRRVETQLFALVLVRPAGIEPATCGFEAIRRP